MDYLKQLMHYRPQTKEERLLTKQLLDKIDRLGDKLLYRDNTAAHFTASSIIINQDFNKILMVHHNIYDSYSWAGGHADGERDLFFVALKEAKEETGVKELYPLSGAVLSIDALDVSAHIKDSAPVDDHVHYNFTFGFYAPEKQVFTIKEDENSAVTWLDIDRMDTWCNEKKMIPIYKKILRRLRELDEEKNAAYALLPALFLPWYDEHKRDLPWRADTNPYHVWLSEIMLQQTRVDTVIPYYKRFLSQVPSIAALAALDEEKLLKLWEGLGYYSRARNLQKAAQIIVEQHNGCFPQSFEQIRQLPGIGDYTAGAIASICFNQPTPAVDGNVLRVLCRIGENYESIDNPALKKKFATTTRVIRDTHSTSRSVASLFKIP